MARPPTTHDNAAVREFLCDELAKDVQSRIDDVLTGTLELQDENRTSTRTMRRKVLRAILEHCDVISVSVVRDQVTRDRYADRTLRYYAEAARVASKQIAASVLPRAHYGRVGQLWYMLPGNVGRRVDFMPPGAAADDTGRHRTSLRQARAEIDGPYAAEVQAAEADGTPWSPATARGLVNVGERVRVTVGDYVGRYTRHFETVGPQRRNAADDRYAGTVLATFPGPQGKRPQGFGDLIKGTTSMADAEGSLVSAT